MTKHLRIATFNVLADSYTKYGDYHQAPANLMAAGGRTQPLVSLITRLEADIVCLQEVEEPLVEALDATDQWRPFWSKKQNAPDGCLTLVRNGLASDEPETIRYSDGSGSVAQVTKIGKITVANTHVKFEMPNRIAQTKELLAEIATESHVALLGDFNDRPGEPARSLVAEAGFENLLGDTPTAFIANRDGAASIDLFAVRGLQAELTPIDLGEDFDIREIPSYRCPSDHTPAVGQVMLP